jgi:hypothetical protein
MSFPKKHIYKEGSPGAAREKAKITLTQIKLALKLAGHKTATRRDYRNRGLLAKARKSPKSS